MRLLKPFLTTLALFFALFVVFVPVLREHNISFGLDFESDELNLGLEEVSSPSALIDSSPLAGLKEVDYYLPYPGILPDHPLYWLKMIRDRILLILAKEPTARFQRLLLYADKRIGAAEALIKGRKETLGVSTATKAEKYLQQAVEAAEKLKEEGKLTAIASDQIKKAVEKHNQLLGELLAETRQGKDILKSTLELTQRNYQKVLNEIL